MLHPPLHQDMPRHDVEPPPRTTLDAVTAEYVFPSGEPGYDWDSESMTLGEGMWDFTLRQAIHFKMHSMNTFEDTESYIDDSSDSCLIRVLPM